MHSTEATEVADPSPRKKLLGLPLPVLLGAVAAIAAAVVVAALLLTRGSGLSGESVVVGFPRSDGEMEVHLSTLGQATGLNTVLADDVTAPEGEGASGGAITMTEDGWALVNTSHEDGGSITSVRTDDPAKSIEMIDSNYPLSLRWADTGFAFVTEYVDDGVRCYIGEPGERASRAARGFSCELTPDNRTLIYSEETEDDEFDLFAVPVDELRRGRTPNPVVLARGIRGWAESLVGFLQFSAEGDRFAYWDERSGEVEIVVVDYRANSEIFREEAAYLTFSFAPTGAGFAYVSTEGDESTLHLSTDGLKTQEIASAEAVSSVFSGDGRTVVYGTHDEDTAEVHAYDVASGNDEVVFDDIDASSAFGVHGERIFATAEDGDQLLVRSLADDEAVAVDAVDDDDVIAANVGLPSGALIVRSTQEGGETSLLYLAAGGEDAVEVLEGYAEANVIGTLGDTELVLQGREAAGDNMTLMTVTLEGPSRTTEIDNADGGFAQPYVSPDGDRLLYTSYGEFEEGEDFEVEVRSARLDAATPAQTEYDDAVVLWSAWDMVEHPGVEATAFLGTGEEFVGSEDGEAEAAAPSGTAPSDCYEPVTLAINELFFDALLPSSTNCYHFSVSTETAYAIDAVSDEGDLYLELHDGYGSLLAEDDDTGHRLNPSIYQVLAPGDYYVIVSDLIDNGASFEIRVSGDASSSDSV